MDETTMIARNPNLLDTHLDNEVVMVHLDMGQYFNLNDTASRIWDLLKEGPMALGEIADILVEEYEIDKEGCVKELTRFIETIKTKDILSVTNGSGTASPL